MDAQFFDRLPEPVRHRLAQSDHNICAGCLVQEGESGEAIPSVQTYLNIIAAVEPAR